MIYVSFCLYFFFSKLSSVLDSKKNGIRKFYLIFISMLNFLNNFCVNPRELHTFHLPQYVLCEIFY